MPAPLLIGSSWTLDKVDTAPTTAAQAEEQQQELKGRLNYNDDCYWLIRPSNDEDPLQVQHGQRRDASHHLAATAATTGSQEIFRLSFPSCRDTNTFPEHHTQQDETSVAAAVVAMDNDGDVCTPPNQKNLNIGTKRLYRDNRVQIWEFRLQPGEACPYHDHTRAYFFLNLTASINQELNAAGDPVPNSLPSNQVAGQCTYISRECCGSHAVRNVGETLFLQFIVEFLYTNRAQPQSSQLAFLLFVYY